MRNLNIGALCRDLNKLCNDLDKKIFINSGGCCFVASLIAYHFDKLGFKYKLVILSRNKKNINKITKEVNSKAHNNCTENSITHFNCCAHYYLLLDGGGYINLGDFNYKEYYRYSMKVHCSKISWIYKTGNWNDTYNIKYNKYIRKAFKIFFSPYEKRYKTF